MILKFKLNSYHHLKKYDKVELHSLRNEISVSIIPKDF
jgi:hypothetical protein